MLRMSQKYLEGVCSQAASQAFWGILQCVWSSGNQRLPCMTKRPLDDVGVLLRRPSTSSSSAWTAQGS